MWSIFQGIEKLEVYIHLIYVRIVKLSRPLRGHVEASRCSWKQLIPMNETARPLTPAVCAQVFTTYSNEDYDRSNSDVDPMAASAEYELEKRVEKLELFPVELEKGLNASFWSLSLVSYVTSHPHTHARLKWQRLERGRTLSVGLRLHYPLMGLELAWISLISR